MSINYRKLAVEVREFMTKNNMNNKQFCKLSGMNESTFSRFLSGESRYLTSVNVEKITAVLRSSITNYETQLQPTYENMTIEELNDLMDVIREVRNRKIEQELSSLRGKVDLYEKMLNEQEEERYCLSR